MDGEIKEDHTRDVFVTTGEIEGGATDQPTVQSREKQRQQQQQQQHPEPDERAGDGLTGVYGSDTEAVLKTQSAPTSLWTRTLCDSAA